MTGAIGMYISIAILYLIQNVAYRRWSTGYVSIGELLVMVLLATVFPITMLISIIYYIFNIFKKEEEYKRAREMIYKHFKKEDK